MPLLTDERTATEILTRVLRQDPDVGLNNYARVVLGAHSEQARKLASRADQIVRGADIDDYDWPSDERTLQGTAQVNGKELNFSLKSDRLPITTLDELIEFFSVDTAVWNPESFVANFWGSKDNPNFQVKSTLVRDDYATATAEDREAFRQWAAEQVPPDTALAGVPLVSPNSQMLEIVIADLHAERFVPYGPDPDEIITRMYNAVCKAYDTASRVNGTVPAQVEIVLLGDTFNSNDARGTAVKGTPQENSPAWREVFSHVRSAIARLAQRFRGAGSSVGIRVLYGNHDRDRAFYLSDSLWAYFANTPGVEVHVQSGERQYIHWGGVSIGLTHGDDLTDNDAVMTFLREVGSPVFAEIHAGHYHSRRINELHGVTVRRFGAAAEPNQWELQRGYTHNERSITAILWDSRLGRVLEIPGTLGVTDDE